jgi:hypothetical protein
MHNRNAIKKGIFISLMSVSLLFSFTSISLADEKGGSMGGMNMGGSTTTQTAPVEKSEQDAMPGMDPNMEGMGHGESSEASEGVNWIIVGGFLAINALIIISAGILKSSKKVQSQL